MTGVSPQNGRIPVNRRHDMATAIFPRFAAVLALVLSAGCDPFPGMLDGDALAAARNRGLAHLEENRLDAADSLMSEIIRMAPMEALGYANRGVAHLRRGEYEPAREDLRSALEREPGNVPAAVTLADVERLDGDASAAIPALEAARAAGARHPRLLWSLASAYGLRGGSDDVEHRRAVLEELLAGRPGSLPAHLALLQTQIETAGPESLLELLAVTRRHLPAGVPEVDAALDGFALAVRDGDAAAATAALARTRNLLAAETVFRADMAELVGADGLPGMVAVQFSPSLIRRIAAPDGATPALSFAAERLPSGAPLSSGGVLAFGDVDGDGAVELLYGGGEGVSLLQRRDGAWRDIGPAWGLPETGTVADAAFADLDNDRRLDLYLVRPGRDLLLRNDGTQFQDVTAAAGLTRSERGNAVLPGDFDHDGDLDLLVTTEGFNRFYRNNGDGTFSERGPAMGLAGPPHPGQRAVMGDVDDDGDLDLFVNYRRGRHTLFENRRGGRFEARPRGMPVSQSGAALARGDVDNDGDLDLLLPAATRGVGLFLNRGDGAFEPSRRVMDLAGPLGDGPVLDAMFLDVDNDGWLDVLAATEAAGPAGSGLRLFRNHGDSGFVSLDSLLPPAAARVVRVAAADIDGDGDLDPAWLGADGSAAILRNNGGNLNHYLAVRLEALPRESGKINSFGIGSRLEVSTGTLTQTRVVDGPVTHIGLGANGRAERVRVQWTNGVPQNRLDVAGDQDIVERQVLKGSCPFLYAWDGERFAFVTDLLWRSALGMPLGIMGGETAYAQPAAADEYARIEGALLAAREGRYDLRLTAELWETHFIDGLHLVAVDHPDSVDVFIDEQLTLPPYEAPVIHTVRAPRPPVAAHDGNGRDVLDVVARRDSRYLGDFIPTRFQGIVAPHELILDLGDVAPAQRVVLYLNGWIFPSDASINVAVAQGMSVTVQPPRIDIADGRGGWRPLIPRFGFPRGKRKTVILDLGAPFDGRDNRIRIATSMQIYWDQVFFTVDEPSLDVLRTRLDPVAADLRYRGFHREYRENRNGPHLFDYDSVRTGPLWRDLEGYYTRFGDVRELLTTRDNRYVILNAGDEIALSFAVADAPPLPEGWRRDFLIYADGWVKDGDLNTGHGQTVEPLPWHGMAGYPGEGSRGFPDDSLHRAFRAEYNTRYVSPTPFARDQHITDRP